MGENPPRSIKLLYRSHGFNRHLENIPSNSFRIYILFIKLWWFEWECLPLRLNVWIPDAQLVTLFGKSRRCGPARGSTSLPWKFISHIPVPVHSLCFLLEFRMWASPLCRPPVCLLPYFPVILTASYPSRTTIPKKPFLLWVTLVMMFSHSNRKETNTHVIELYLKDYLRT